VLAALSTPIHAVSGISIGPSTDENVQFTDAE
jgi:hypothetical protein